MSEKHAAKDGILGFMARSTRINVLVYCIQYSYDSIYVYDTSKSSRSDITYHAIC